MTASNSSGRYCDEPLCLPIYGRTMARRARDQRLNPCTGCEHIHAQSHSPRAAHSTTIKPTRNSPMFSMLSIYF